jgi:cation transport protein ChaC
MRSLKSTPNIALSVPLLRRETRITMLDEALARAPHDVTRVDTWFFTYGAMLETPPFTPVEDEVVVCEGWRRDFCLADTLLRGTAERPGAVLGLLAGGTCTGVAWRLLAQRAREDLIKVFEDELRLPFYRAGWTRVRSPRGETFALILRADEESPLFQPTLSRDDLLDRLAGSHGEAGPNAAYLENVVAALNRRGVPDLELSRLLRELRERRAPTP